MPKRIAITSGEPAGIGPDLCALLTKQDHDNQLIIIGDFELLRERARQLNLTVDFKHYHANDAVEASRRGTCWVHHIPLIQPAVCGQINPANSPHVIEMLTVAVQGALDNTWDAIVTAPVHKGVINDAGIPFSGHTEFFRDYCRVPEVVMMLATLDLRVALVTTHLPLRDVADAITEERVTRVARILNNDLKRFFNLDKPHILVAGLNPHAGEDGHLGREEIDVITPTLNTLRQEGLTLSGPLPADTLFTPKFLDNADAVLAMYHDQGLPVLKFHGFGRAANITLGLPIVRTSVDHGTALDLAGTGAIDEGSLYTAVQIAEQMSMH